MAHAKVRPGGGPVAAADRRNHRRPAEPPVTSSDRVLARDPAGIAADHAARSACEDSAAARGYRQEWRSGELLRSDENLAGGGSAARRSVPRVGAERVARP